MGDHQNEMKRFTFRLGEINFQKIHDKCKSILNLSDADRITLKYLDQENDWITIKTTEDLSDAIKESLRLLQRNYLQLKVLKNYCLAQS